MNKEGKKKILLWYIYDKGYVSIIHPNFTTENTVEEIENFIKFDKSYPNCGNPCERCLHGNTDGYKGIYCIDECIPNNYNGFSFPYGYWNKIMNRVVQ